MTKDVHGSGPNDAKPKPRIIVSSRPKKDGSLESEIAPNCGHEVVANPVGMDLVDEGTLYPKNKSSLSTEDKVTKYQVESKKEETMTPPKSSKSQENISLDNDEGSGGSSSVGNALGALALVAVAALGYFVYQGQEQNKQLQNTLTTLETKMSGVSDKLIGISQGQESLKVDTSSQVSKLNQDIQAQSSRINQIGGEQDWKSHEARYLIVMAIERLQAFGDVSTAMTLLQSADFRLQEMASPETLKARQAIAHDLSVLRAIALPDTQGIWVQLGALSQQLAQLTFFSLEDPDKRPQFLDSTSASQESTSKTSDSSSATWKDSLNQSWQEVKGLVKVRDFKLEEFSLVISNKEQAQLLATMQLLVEQARWAATHKNQMIFEGSLEDLKAWVEKFFVDNAQRASVMKDIEGLKQAPISFELPDISASLMSMDSLIRKKEMGYQAPVQSSALPQSLPAEPTVAPPPEAAIEEIPLDSESAEPELPSEDGDTSYD